MKKYLVLVGTFLILQTVFLIAGEEDIIWMKETHNNNYVEFSPNKNLFLSWGSHGGESRKGVIIFNTDGDTVKVIYNSEGLEFRSSQGIWDAHFSRDGRFLAVIWEYDKDNLSHGMIEIFETENWTSEKKIEVPGDDFSLLGAQILLSPDNKTIVGITQEGFYFYDVQSGELLKHVWNYGQDLTKNIIVAYGVYSSYGSHIYFTSTDMKPTTSGDEKLRFLNTQTYEVEYTSDAITNHIAISKSGNMITKVANSDELQIINPITKEIILKIPVHTDEIRGMAFTNDENYLGVSYFFSELINIYDIKTGKIAKSITKGTYESISFSKDDIFIISHIGRYLILLSNTTTSVNDNKPGFTNILYPNPTNGSFNIKFENKLPGVVKINLYEGTGKLIKNLFTRNLDAGEQNINSEIRGIKAGIYFIKVNSIGTDITFKLIINK